MSSAHNSWGSRLYRGDVSYDIVGNQKRWYLISGVLALVSVFALVGIGLNFSLDFRGGSQYTVPSPSMTIAQAKDVIAQAAPDVKNPVITVQTTAKERDIIVKTTPIDAATSIKIQDGLAKAAGTTEQKVTVLSVSGSWGKQISDKAIQGLIIFVILVMIYLAIFFEWKMAIAAMVSLVHDILITVGIYALVGFEVSPATVVGILTILGYSLYDTVVVFDKVKENTKNLGQAGRNSVTYTQAANLAVNQTLVRSLNTSFVALLPVAALLFAGFVVGGAGVLQDLALALFVGIAVGTYSSITIATPVLADLKERETDLRNLAKKVEKNRADAGPAGLSSVQDRNPDAFNSEDDLSDDVSALAAPRGPRNQPVRDKNRSRPSGKKR